MFHNWLSLLAGSARPLSRLEAAYNASILGGGIRATYDIRASSGAREGVPDLARLLRGVKEIVSLRKQQFIVDYFVRGKGTRAHKGSPVLCAPHLPSVYAHAVPTPETKSVRALRGENRRSHPREQSTKHRTDTKTRRRSNDERDTSAHTPAHLSPPYATPPTKQHVFRKMRFSLGEAVLYALQRCTHTRTNTSAGAPSILTPTYRGAIFTYSVRSTSRPGGRLPTRYNHYNMVFLDFGTAAGLHREGGDVHATPPPRVRCYLFEPNGESFAHTQSDGLVRLKEAWAWVRARASLPTEPAVRIVGARIDHGAPRSTTAPGIQTLLGETIRTVQYGASGKTVRTTKRGYGVCGAITYWFFHSWLTTIAEYAAAQQAAPHSLPQAPPTLEAYYTQFYRDAKQRTTQQQAALLRFIEAFNRATFAHYGTHTAHLLHRDLTGFFRHVKRTQQMPSLRVTTRINIATHSPVRTLLSFHETYV